MNNYIVFLLVIAMCSWLSEAWIKEKCPINRVMTNSVVVKNWDTAVVIG